jgi:hypothetical protein
MTNKITEYTFGGRLQIPAENFLNTSGLHMPNEIVLEKDGKKIKCGYYSNSALGTYAGCQKAFEFKYIKKEKGSIGIAAFEGIAVHTALENMLRPKIKKEKPLSKEETLQIFRDDFEKTTKNAQLDWAKHKYSKDTTIDLNIKMLETIYPVVATLEPLAVEKHFILPIPIEGTEGSLCMSGFIDLVEVQKGQNIVTDFKTGSLLKNDMDLLRDTQLTLYSMFEGTGLVSFITMKKGTPRTTKISPKTGKEIQKSKGVPSEMVRVSGRKSVKDYQRITEDITAMAKSISQGNFARTGKNNPRVCGTHCPFFDKCLR